MKLATVNVMKWANRTFLIFLCSGVLFAQSRPADSGLIAHEWGTFTSVAGSDGQAVEWTPLSLNNGDGDLPGFVEHLHFSAFKLGLRGTVRMETPVLYFYSSRNISLSVHVEFSKGLITEWYPHAAAPLADGGLNDIALYQKHAADGSISWSLVALEPGSASVFPRDSLDNDNRYYAARETSATPLRVTTAKSDQREKFLFYRGVSFLSVPVSAKLTVEGDLLVRNSLEEGIPAIIWFERRGDRVGYRISEGLQDEAVLEPPELTGRIESLYGDLEEMLVARGLFREEAHAMVQTWRDSWFEEGSRLFYILPARFVDSILPLTITPAPAETVRVFVGRLEIITPATQEAVAAALASHDQATLSKYSRFLEPILKIVQERNAAKGKQIPESQGSKAEIESPR